MPESKNFKKTMLLGCTAFAALIAGTVASSAQSVSAPETVVVTGTRFNTDAAPAKASLETTEPETIINRAYIENFQEPQADYVSILAIVPSLTGGDPNGTGLSDGGPKNTLRGFADGNFNLTYDGIPFGDTNGPTHHNISYFPASTIGSAIVDRGPGNAGNLGPNTYGGTIKLFSEGLTDDMHARAVASYGSFGTTLEGLNAQSGQIDTGVGTIRAMGNVQYLHSDGALQGQDLFSNNVLLKVEDELNSHWRITLFGNSAFLKENLDDNNGATPAQVSVYGKNFALQSNNPNLPTYSPYNFTSKHTDMDYVRVDGDIFSWLKVDNTDYTYAYWNHTFSPNNQNQTLADIQNGTSEGNYGTGQPNSAFFFATGTKDPNLGILAYSKQNAYRVYGDIFRLSADYDLGWVSGQIRGGVWWETQATHRFKYYFDSISCFQKGVDVFDVGDVSANASCGVAFKPFNGAPYNGPAGAGVAFSKAKSIQVGQLLGVNQLGYAKDDEHSDWTQYEPFLEWDIHPFDSEALRITPGVKFIHWDHAVNAPAGQGNLCGVGANNVNTGGICPNAPGENYQVSFITRKVLPFAEVNYKIEPSWSAYFEYAQGIYVPDIGTFEQNPPTAPGKFPAAETTTNYQFGTVYYADSFTFDADVYYIPINNNYTVAACPPPDQNESCFQNTGQATYKGIEGEGTYAFGDELMEMWGIDLHGLSVFANGALMYSKSGGHWVQNAPEWTAAAGIIYVRDHWKFALIDKHVGRQFADNVDTKHYEIPVYSQLNLTAGYTYGNAELDINVDNLLDSRKVTSISGVTSAPAVAPSWQTDQAQYFFQGPRTVMATIKWRY